MVIDISLNKKSLFISLISFAFLLSFGAVSITTLAAVADVVV